MAQYEGLRRPFKHNGRGLIDNLARRGTPDRVYHMELFHDGEMANAIIQRFELDRGLNANDPDYWRKRHLAFVRFLGFDYVSAGPAGQEWPLYGTDADDTAGLSRGKRRYMDERRGPITTWEEFEKYPWPDPHAPGLAAEIEWWNKNLPDDMVLFLGSIGHFCEFLTWLFGYESLCYALYDNRGLVRAVSDRLLEYYRVVNERLLQFERLKALWPSDDMGYRGGTLISPDDMREFCLPGHKMTAEMAHKAGCLCLLHSCGNLNEIVDDLMGLSETMREKNIKEGVFRETAIERLTEFLVRLSHSSTDPAYLTVYRRTETGITLEVRNIDPAASLSEVCGSHSCCVLISGTLSPVESFCHYYFGDAKVTTLSLPNAFPKENRLIACANDITTAFSMRQNKDNTNRICDYIKAFSALKGNRACYFPSYQILESFASLTVPHMRGRKTYIEPRDAANASAALNEFLSLPTRGESGVMFAVCGGKWSEGLDYRGEMLNGAMVIGLPLAPFNRVRKMTIEYFRHKFGEEGEFICYTLPAVNRSLQALGRVLRTPEDRGVLVLGEKRFLERRVKNALPGWIKEEMIECDVTRFRELIGKWRS